MSLELFPMSRSDNDLNRIPMCGSRSSFAEPDEPTVVLPRLPIHQRKQSPLVVAAEVFALAILGSLIGALL